MKGVMEYILNWCEGAKKEGGVGEIGWMG